MILVDITVNDDRITNINMSNNCLNQTDPQTDIHGHLRTERFYDIHLSMDVDKIYPTNRAMIIVIHYGHIENAFTDRTMCVSG